MPVMPGTGGSKMPGAGASQAQFLSTEQTGTGANQNIAHSLGQAPTAVAFLFTGGTVVASVVEGTHTATNVVINVTSGSKFRVIAWA